MALGIARNGQTAGWSGGPPSVDFTVNADVGYAVYDTPVYSFARNTTDRNGSIKDGTYNLTGLGSISGYNNARWTVLLNVYLPWPSGLADDFYGQPGGAEVVIGGGSPVYIYTSVSISGGALVFTSGSSGFSIQCTLPGAYTTYTNRWLTVVFSNSETATTFASWAPTGLPSGLAAGRVAVYDSETRALINKQDAYSIATYPAWSTLPATTTTSQASGSNYINFQTFGGLGQELRQTQLAMWIGSTWDSVTNSSATSDTSWLATRPTATLGNSGAGTALFNIVYSDYGISGSDYFATEHFNDLFVPDVATQAFKLTNGGSTAFTAGYDNTIYPTSQGTG